MSYYLRSNVVAEPLVNRWYAWPMLISPATSALYLTNAHMKIMQSYLKMPKMHAAATKSSEMRGGPFIDCEGDEKVRPMNALIENITKNCAHILEFSNAIDTLNTIINTCDGHSLIDLYEKVPECLRGYVELYYDVRNNVGFRIIEPLLYRSNIYNENGQEISLSLINNDHRFFVLSTPRFQESHNLNWKIPFHSAEIDDFFSMRDKAKSKSELDTFFSNNFISNEANYKHFMSFFKEGVQKSKTDNKYKGSGIRIRYYGHASVLIESSDVSILIDGMISYAYPTELQRYSYDDLPDKIDYVLLTHSHQDHVMLEHLLQLRFKIGHIVIPKNVSGALQDPSLKLMFKKLNFNVIELDELDSIDVPGGEITGLPFFGEHGDLNIRSKMAYAISLRNYSLLFLADSNNLEPYLYRKLKLVFKRFDIIFLGMECDGAPMSWLYQPVLLNPISRSMDQSRRLNGSDCEKAMDIIRQFDCKEIYIYAMGKEPWLGYITSIEYTKKSKPITESNRLIEICKSEGRYAERPYIRREIIKEAV